MRLTKEDIEDMRTRLERVGHLADEYFEEAGPFLRPARRHGRLGGWEIDDIEMLNRREGLRQSIMSISVDIAGAARGSPLLGEAEIQELRHSTWQMLANVCFREYHHAGFHVLHDEDVVLGVDPPSREEIPFQDASTAARRFHEEAAKVRDLTGLLLPADAADYPQRGTSNYRPNTAFVMMPIDEGNPELEDIRTAIKEVFQEYGIQAITVDEIEHEEAITDRILAEIEGSEFLLADLTQERPNVYYEIGHAHAMNKRVILVRKKNTKLHFDIAHRNCPEYENATGLKKLLRKRLEAMTNKRGPGGNP